MIKIQLSMYMSRLKWCDIVIIILEYYILFIEVRYLIFLWLKFVHVLLIICLGTVTKSSSKMHLIESNKHQWMLKFYLFPHTVKHAGPNACSS